jgi:hypothetical protein
MRTATALCMLLVTMLSFKTSLQYQCEQCNSSSDSSADVVLTVLDKLLHEGGAI